VSVSLEDIPVRAASTVVLLRDAAAGLEALLVRRNRALAFAGGFWVFPGGAVDEKDRAAAAGDADEAARVAAAREAGEEAGVSPDPAGMVLISHWTTPIGEAKRFATWFYAAACPADSDIRIDRDEIHDYRWLSPGAALRQHRGGELPMLPPTYITLCALERYACVEEALSGERASPCPRILPVMVPIEGEGGFATLYPGDAGYDDGRVDHAGPRHRSVLRSGAWTYIYEGVQGAAPLYPVQG
jgi:8-oxo-dGTP pyrophosphatase MutT (NUDIX family)